jgi:hypothetical protein
MAKTVEMTLAGVAYEMPASYKVAKEIGQRVGDPLKMAITAEQGDVPWTLENVIDIIWIGAKAAGCSLSREDVGDEVMEFGLGESLEKVGQLIGHIVAGGPAKPVKDDGGKK